jgi:outer membrane protein OmpA-like peptidoglycan-associated protein
LLLALGWWFCGKGAVPAGNTNTNMNKPANVVTNVNTNAVANVNSNANAAPAGEKKLTEVVLPNGTKLQAFPGGIEDQLIKFIQSDEYKNGTEASLKEKWFSFDDLNFIFGKTELTPESKRQLDNITAILKAFPDVKVKIGGYTDKKGDDAANKKLSDARAKAVQAALGKAGVGSQVPSAEGYGEEFAKVPETGTDEERKVDRKTAVRLIKGDAKVTDASAKPAADANAKPATAANTTAANTANANAKPANK